jgi:two-component system cell cycle sensor histidine kinase/response regulator CckA
MGGKEAMERLGKINRKVNAILASGYAQDSAMTEFEKFGFKAAIAKPFTLEELSKTLRSVTTARTSRVH